MQAMEAEIVSGQIMLILILAAVAVAAYFLGCFNGAVIVSKYILRDDIRTHGSGNGGLTNFYRTFGGPLTLAVILCDVVKAVLAVLIGSAVLGTVLGGAMGATFGKFLAGTFCMLGHMFPCMFGFRGGKGILSGGTVAIMVDWRIALVVWGCFFVLVTLTKWVSLGSTSAGVVFPVATWFVYQNWVFTGFALVCGGLIVWKHRENLKRILKGNESKFSFHRKS